LLHKISFLLGYNSIGDNEDASMRKIIFHIYIYVIAQLRRVKLPA